MGVSTGTLLESRLPFKNHFIFTHCFCFLLREISGGADSSPSHGYVNELYCIMEPSIPLDIVTTRTKALALQLWQNTKQALAPFPLIN